MDNNNKQNQNSNWQTITMLVVAALLTILIVGWMNSTVNARQRQELSYNEFVNMVENGKVESISVGSTIIEVKPKADDTNYSQQMKYYVVRLEGDYQFVDRLIKNNVPAVHYELYHEAHGWRRNHGCRQEQRQDVCAERNGDYF